MFETRMMRARVSEYEKVSNCIVLLFLNRREDLFIL